MIMTVVLITSSLTMLGAVDSAKAGDKAKTRRFLWSTILLGVIFAALHIREWIAMLDEGVRLFQTPGVRLFLELPFSVSPACTCFTSSAASSPSPSSRAASRGAR